MRSFSGCILVLIVSLTSAISQTSATPVTFSPDAASEHLLSKTEPIYPPIAKTARLQGDVQLQVVVDGHGGVKTVKVLSGHPFFTQAAIDAVRQWKYTPFSVNGTPVLASIPVKVSFSLGIPEKQYQKEAAAADEYFKAEETCLSRLRARDFPSAEPACHLLPALAEKLPKERQMERISAYKYAGHSFFYQRKFGEALTFYQQELASAKLALSETDAELGYAYRDLAHAQHMTGQVADAKLSYKSAVTVLEKAHSHIDSAFLKNEYSRTLQATLREYGTLLKQTGDTAGAVAANSQADSIVVKEGLQDR